MPEPTKISAQICAHHEAIVRDAIGWARDTAAAERDGAENASSLMARSVGHEVARKYEVLANIAQRWLDANPRPLVVGVTGTATPAVVLVALERLRQVEQEGWTPEHDDKHAVGELAQAAACYAWVPPRPLVVKEVWPWDRHWWKPAMPEELTEKGKEQARIRDLVKAGALIVAEIERLQRAALSTGGRDA